LDEFIANQSAFVSAATQMWRVRFSTASSFPEHIAALKGAEPGIGCGQNA